MTRPYSLLVVDDEEDFRLVLRDHFEDLGYEIAEAPDGAVALEIFDENPRRFDLVITDIRMPRLSGEELIPQLRQRRRHLPIIGVTGHADLSGKLSLLDNGAYYYLDKPLPQWPIVDRLVENAIRLHRYEEQVAVTRAKEEEIARLLRAYILHESSAQTLPRRRLASPEHAARHHAIDLDIGLHYIENDRPGGDYAEWFERGPDEIIFYLADASGHDDLLATFMTCLAGLVLHRSHRSRHDESGAEPPVDHLIEALDAALSRLREAGALGHERYLTLFLGTVELASGRLRYVNAGHPEALLLRCGTDGERLASNARPAGFFFGLAPEVGEIELRPGDILFLYTDGASEMLEDADGGGEKSGADLLADLVERHGELPARQLVDRLAEHLTERAGPAGFEDDTTLMAIKVLAVE